jgi:hypothetical protein
MGFSLHSHYCAEHAAAWRKRVGEMREPPLGLDNPPGQGARHLLRRGRGAPDTAALLVGLYEHAVPALLDALGGTWTRRTGWSTIRRSGSAASRSSRSRRC